MAWLLINIDQVGSATQKGWISGCRLLHWLKGSDFHHGGLGGCRTLFAAIIAAVAQGAGEHLVSPIALVAGIRLHMLIELLTNSNGLAGVQASAVLQIQGEGKAWLLQLGTQ